MTYRPPAHAEQAAAEKHAPTGLNAVVAGIAAVIRAEGSFAVAPRLIPGGYRKLARCLALELMRPVRFAQLADGRVLFAPADPEEATP